MSVIFSQLLHAPGRVAAVASVTFTQLVRMRLFVVLTAFVLGFLALQFLPYQQNLGVEFAGLGQLQLIQDVAVGCMRLFSMLFCVTATALLIPRDSEDRILYTILSKPVPHFDYLLGKALGVLGVLLVMLAIMDGMMVLLMQLRIPGIAADLREQLTAAGLSTQEMQPYIDRIHAVGNTLDTQLGVLVLFMGMAVLTSLTLLISCLTSGTIVSIVMALGVFFIGMFQGSLFQNIAAASGHPGTSDSLQWTEHVFSVLIPNFSLFSVTDATTAGESVSLALLGGLGLIALAYVLLHLAIASWVLARKEF